MWFSEDAAKVLIDGRSKSIASATSGAAMQLGFFVNDLLLLFILLRAFLWEWLKVAIDFDIGRRSLRYRREW